MVLHQLRRSCLLRLAISALSTVQSAADDDAHEAQEFRKVDCVLSFRSDGAHLTLQMCTWSMLKAIRLSNTERISVSDSSPLPSASASTKDLRNWATCAG